MVNLLEVFARQLLKDEYDITGPTDLEHAARLFTQELERVNAKKFSNVWSVLSGNPPVQVFPQELARQPTTEHL